MVGKIIGNCKITEKIGIGGFGAVYKGVQVSLNRDVAIKALHSQFIETPGFVQRFQAEAKILASLNHPNIVQVYDIVEANETYFIIMEYVRGETLKDILTRQNKLPIAQGLEITEDVASALIYTHNKNIIHRDIKPANIIITEEGTAKVMDFGIAKVIGESAESFTRVGTVSYAPPEQINGEPIDARADIYALGSTLYQIISGQIPEIVETTPLSKLAAEIPSFLDKVVMKAIQKNKETRYPSMEEFLKDIKEAYNTLNQKEMPSLDHEKTVFMKPSKQNSSMKIYQLIKKTITITALSIIGIIMMLFLITKERNQPIIKESGKKQAEIKIDGNKETPADKLPLDAVKDKEEITVPNQNISQRYYDEGVKFTSQELWLEAIKSLELSLSYNQNNDRAHYELGYAYSHLTGRFNESESHMKKAVELNPKNVMYRYGLGVLYLESGKKDSAVQVWEEALRLEPQNHTLQAVIKKYKSQ